MGSADSAWDGYGACVKKIALHIVGAFLHNVAEKALQERGRELCRAAGKGRGTTLLVAPFRGVGCPRLSCGGLVISVDVELDTVFLHDAMIRLNSLNFGIYEKTVTPRPFSPIATATHYFFGRSGSLEPHCSRGDVKSVIVLLSTDFAQSFTESESGVLTKASASKCV